jgi:hypothetical protein
MTKATRPPTRPKEIIQASPKVPGKCLSFLLSMLEVPTSILGPQPGIIRVIRNWFCYDLSQEREWNNILDLLGQSLDSSVGIVTGYGLDGRVRKCSGIVWRGRGTMKSLIESGRHLDRDSKLTPAGYKSGDLPPQPVLSAYGPFIYAHY